MRGPVVCLRSAGRFLLWHLVGKYGSILVMGMLALLLGAGAYLSRDYDKTGNDGARQGTVYSVAMVRANLVRDPAAWIGRSVLVRGFLDGGPRSVGPGHESYARPRLLDLTHLETVASLAMSWTGPGSVTMFLRGMPVLGARMPLPQRLHWEEMAIYRVQLQALPAASCPSAFCYEGVVLDTAPGDMGE